MTVPSPWRGRFALVLFGLLFGLAVGELAVRLILPAPPDLVEPRRPEETGLRELESIYELASPNVEGIYRGAYYRSNRFGFRGRDYPKERVPGTLRIVAIGDSFMMGEGVREEEAYAGVLEVELSKRLGRPVEVLNLGMSGANIHHVVDRLELLGLGFDPDLILYGYTTNDIEVEGYRKSIDTATIVEQRARFARFADSRSHLMRLLWPRWTSFRTGLDPPKGTYMYEVLDNYLGNPKVWAEVSRGFDRLAQVERERGIPVVVFVHPVLAYLRAFHPFGEVYDKIRDAAEARGLDAIVGFPGVSGRDAESLWVSPSNPHPNSRAHRLFAEVLLDRLPQVPDVAAVLR